MYPNGSQQLLSGCKCGAKVFFFIKSTAIKKDIEQLKSLSVDERTQIANDVLDVIGIEEPDKPVILDLECINVMSPGKYELDLVRMFKGDPLIFRIEDGKYIIDVAETFEKYRKR
jgi:predicted  nucleic acid-binding Zn-ribbon protein